MGATRGRKGERTRGETERGAEAGAAEICWGRGCESEHCCEGNEESRVESWVERENAADKPVEE